MPDGTTARSACFNPRAPGGARFPAVIEICRHRTSLKFQSTRPRRGAMTRADTDNTEIICFNPRAPGGARCPRHTAAWPVRKSFNPRAPGGARWLVPGFCASGSGVSIHAPPEGRDPTQGKEYEHTGMFQSTRPRRGAIAIF